MNATTTFATATSLAGQQAGRVEVAQHRVQGALLAAEDALATLLQALGDLVAVHRLGGLVEHAEVEIQVGPDKFTARTRTASAEEKPALWRRMAANLPAGTVRLGTPVQRIDAAAEHSVSPYAC